MGGMRVKTNKYIEEWAYARENMNTRFKFTLKNNIKILVFAGLIPYGIYQLLIKDLRTKVILDMGWETTLGRKDKFLGYDGTKEKENWKD
mmetsp:Transcript_17389/g.30300  ORF Transcript_17389/g.30300 Transcript_17389/m.30300 type:complete len:90 (-) Transcript_17389:351-620(-)